MNPFSEGYEPTATDYSAVDSRAKAQRLVEIGELVDLLMLPENFGGSRQPENIVFVPPRVADLKEHIDEDIVRQLVVEGKVTEYSVQPTYARGSLVPVGLTVTATNPSTFAQHIVIWRPPSGQDSV